MISARAAVLILGALAAQPAGARGVTPEDLLGLVDLGVPAASPNGQWVAIETRRADLERNTTSIRWIIMPLRPGESPTQSSMIDVGDGGEPISHTSRGQATGATRAQQPQWSPDSEWIAYRVQRAGRVELWRSRRDGSVQEQLTEGAFDTIASFCWSPQATQVLFSGSTAVQAFEQSLQAEADRGYLYDQRFSAYFSRAPLFDEDAIPAQSTQVLELATRAVRPATAEEARACERSEPQWLEDRRADRSVGVNPPLSVAGCRARECTGHFKGAWASDDARTRYFLRWAGQGEYGDLALYEWRAGRRSVRQLLRTHDFIENCERVRARLICAHESATTPRTLIAIDLGTGSWETLFDPNPGFKTLEVGAVTPLTWRDASGIEGFGHLVQPLHATPGQRNPLIIVQYRSRGFLRGGVGDEYPIHVFSANGFAVLSFERPNDPELEARVKNYDELEAKHNEDLRDRRRVLSVLLAGIDHLDRLRVIDPQRVGITGLSDGGETVGFALATESPRFAAAAASWIAWAPTLYYALGPKFQPQLTRFGFGFPRGPLASQWQALSLALNAPSVATPLLLQVSDEELLPETETVAALEAYGKPVEMHVFPNEAHIKVQPRHRLNIYRRNLHWFQFWLQGREASDPVDARQYERWRALRERSQTSAATHASSENN